MDCSGERRRLHTAPSTSTAQHSHLFDAGIELDQQFAYSRRPMTGDAPQSTYGVPWDTPWGQQRRTFAGAPPLQDDGYDSVPVQCPSVHDQYSLVSPSSTLNRVAVDRAPHWLQSPDSLKEQPSTTVPRTAQQLGSAMSVLGLSTPPITSSTTHYASGSHFSPPPPVNPYPLPSRSTSLSIAPIDTSIAPDYRSHSNPTAPVLNPTHTSSLLGYSSASPAGSRAVKELPRQTSHDPAWSPPPFDPHRAGIAPFYDTDAYPTPRSSVSVIPQATWTFPTYEKLCDAAYTDGRKRRKTSPIDMLPLPPQYPPTQVPFYAEHQWGNAPSIRLSDPDYGRFNNAPAIPPFHPHTTGRPSTTQYDPRPPLNPSPTGSQSSIIYSDHSDHHQYTPPPTASLPLAPCVPAQIDCRPSPADFETTEDMVPQPQAIRFKDDKYRPMWVRGVGHSKEGWCKLCPNGGSWFQLRTSAYWSVYHILPEIVGGADGDRASRYHLEFVHGVSAATGVSTLPLPPLSLILTPFPLSTTSQPLSRLDPQNQEIEPKDSVTVVERSVSPPSLSLSPPDVNRSPVGAVSQSSQRHERNQNSRPVVPTFIRLFEETVQIRRGVRSSPGKGIA